MLKFLFYWIAFHTLGRLPLSFLYPLMSGTAWAAYHLAPGVRRNIHDNLRHVMPDVPEAEVRGRLRRSEEPQLNQGTARSGALPRGAAGFTE